VDGLSHNQWTNYFGIGGRFISESVVDLGRNTHQISEYKKIGRKTVYLEIVCGPIVFGQQISEQCKLVIGIDLSLSALKIAKKLLKENGADNYILIQADILNMPISDDTIDLVYGAGVLEHFKNSQKCVDELFRVLNEGGVAFNSVPYLNIGSLTYRQIWGNIPNFPILKQIAEFFHIKLFKGKYMIFGYELSFLGSILYKMHRNSGFKKIYTDQFKVKLQFDYIRFLPFRKMLVRIAESNRLFWPMIKVVAQK
jgi:ubiquinone/menaquinone biosynthesis C-methylase UbiE